MLESELEPGDVIFFMNSMGTADHVAIYSGMREGTHFITHTVAEPYNSIMTTRLKPADLSCHYRVMRPKTSLLGWRAALRMRIWSEHQVPFSVEKQVLYQNLCDAPGFCHPVDGGQQQCALAEHFFRPNFYRYIDFASHPKVPFFPSENMEGFRCSEALVAAFNTEQLLMMDAVCSYTDLNVGWISDQIHPDTLRDFLATLGSEKQPSAAYISYYQRSHDDNEFPYASLPTNNQFLPFACPPSFVAWRTDRFGNIENFLENYKSFALPLDSKITTSLAILVYMQNHPGVWQDMGQLQVVPKVFPLEKIEQDKTRWRAYIQQLFQDAEIKNQDIRQTSESLFLSGGGLNDDNDTACPIKRVLSLSDCALGQSATGEDDDGDNLEARILANMYKSVTPLTSPQRITSQPKPPLSSQSQTRTTRRLFN